MQAIGCVTSLVSLGAFASGIYQGISNSKGIEIEPNTLILIRYGPIALNGLLGIPAAHAFSSDKENLEEMVNGAPPNLDQQEAEGCSKSYAGCTFPFIGVVATSLIEYAGYLVGGAIGASV